MLQARLVSFWRGCKPSQSRGAEYDPIIAQERYEKFRREFLEHLHPAFALEPNKEWDSQLPQLPMQRQLFYTAVFDSICHNFRPLLLLEPAHVRRLPLRKQVLLSSQGATLARSALSVLECVSTLSGMIGATYTRLAIIIFHIFEAGALLLCLCIRGTVPDGDDLVESAELRAACPSPRTAGAMEFTVSRRQCIQAARDTIVRLELLSAVSDLAEASARVLAQLLRQLDSHSASEAEAEPVLPANSSSTLSERSGEQNYTPEDFWPEGSTDTTMGSGTALTKLNLPYFDMAQLGELGDVLLEEGTQGWDAH